jgi:hypothetical protein
VVVSVVMENVEVMMSPPAAHPQMRLLIQRVAKKENHRWNICDQPQS